MARTFEFAVLRLIPDLARAESINLGVVVFHEGSVDVRVGEVLTRARVLFPELNEEELNKNIDVLKRLGSVPLPGRDRHRALVKIGAFALGELGSIMVADDKPESYDAQIAMLLSTFVATPKSSVAKTRSSSRLATEVRKVFRREKVLAAIGDAGALSEHKIVPEWPIPNRPSIRADLALMNGVMRVCELVDLDLREDGPPPPALFEGVVTLDVAQREVAAEQRVFAYRAKGPAARIDEALAIARMHASDLINWEKIGEREHFIHEWTAAAYCPPKEDVTR